MSADAKPTRLARPDLSDRPHQVTVERDMKASPAALYRAWTEEFDSWFASPGAVRMRAREDEPFFFEVEYAGRRGPHYGRFLTLDADRFVELTWITGKGGTEGAETVVSVTFTAAASGTHLKLTHAGFYTQTSAAGAEAAWPIALAHLDECLATIPETKF